MLEDKNGESRFLLKTAAIAVIKSMRGKIDCGKMVRLMKEERTVFR